jgi:20S proteasome subunit beta 2
MHLPFGTMGSGSLAAMGILETRYKDNMNEQEAVELAKMAIEAGIFNDLGSGSNVDIFVVKREGCKKMESYRVYNQKVFSNSNNYTFTYGTTPILESIDYKWSKIEVIEDKMEVV